MSEGLTCGVQVCRGCVEAGSEEETGVCPRGSICKCLLSFTASLSQSGDPAVNFDQPSGPPSHLLHLQTSTRRQMDRQRQTSVNELTERIEAGYPQSAQRGWIRPTDVTESEDVQGTKHASACVSSHVISFNPFSFHQVYTFMVLKRFCQGKCIYAAQFMQRKLLKVM